MLKFTMVENKDGKVSFRYFPEGGSDYGVVSFNEKTGDGSVETLAKNDRHQRYALKMFKRIREMASKGSFAKEGIVAWY
jgi:hypothetical protein